LTLRERISLLVNGFPPGVHVDGPHKWEQLSPLVLHDMVDAGLSVPQERHYWRAVVDGRLAGYGGMDPAPAGGIAWAGPTYVLPQFRGRGLQLRLLEARVAYARKKKVARLVTAVDLDNFASLKNLLAAGFVGSHFCGRRNHLELTFELNGASSRT
jgi:GNAT superfamily N-acetyltransferase